MTAMVNETILLQKYDTSTQTQWPNERKKKYEAHKSHAGQPIAPSSSIDLQSTVLVEITVLVAAINMDEIYKKNYQ